MEQVLSSGMVSSASSQIRTRYSPVQVFLIFLDHVEFMNSCSDGFALTPIQIGGIELQESNSDLIDLVFVVNWWVETTPGNC
jgi:hypothetical protein